MTASVSGLVVISHWSIPLYTSFVDTPKEGFTSNIPFFSLLFFNGVRSVPVPSHKAFVYFVFWISRQNGTSAPICAPNSHRAFVSNFRFQSLFNAINKAAPLPLPPASPAATGRCFSM